MTHVLSFAHKHVYTQSPVGISVPVEIAAGGDPVRLEAKVDTGATYCYFARSYGERLGLNIEDGQKIAIGFANGESTPAYGHTVTIRMFDIVFESVVYFYEDAALRRSVLGCNGWLNRLRVGLVDHTCELYVSDAND